MTTTIKAKPFEVTKREVFEAWKRVKANRGAAGADGESVEEFTLNLSKNLYKLWNRMSSGSYFPKAVRRVEIPKKDGNTRPLGIPTVSDRIAQEVVRARLEKELEQIFHKDSYGYRRGKSALEAVGVCRERNWKYNWVVDVDIQKFFDTIDHDLLLKAVKKHAKEKWVILYIERWLKSVIEHVDGRREEPTMGTPQGGVVSPLLANLYLHYAFDKWMERNYKSIKFERYADDIVIHCKSKEEAQTLKNDLVERLAECRLKLHPEKTKIVYCKDRKRRENYECISYQFLGYTFQPRSVKSKIDGKLMIGFLPSASREAKKHLRAKLKATRACRNTSQEVENLAKWLNPTLRGWFNYFGSYGKYEIWGLIHEIDRRLRKWVQKKYRLSKMNAVRWLNQLRYNQPKLFAHWKLQLQTNG